MSAIHRQQEQEVRSSLLCQSLGREWEPNPSGTLELPWGCPSPALFSAGSGQDPARDRLLQPWGFVGQPHTASRCVSVPGGQDWHGDFRMFSLESLLMGHFLLPARLQHQWFVPLQMPFPRQAENKTISNHFWKFLKRTGGGGRANEENTQL